MTNRSQEDRRPTPALAVLDVAGTTVCDTANVAAVLGEALSRHRLLGDPDEIAAWRGASKTEIIAALVRRAGSGAPPPPEVYQTFQDLLIEAFKRAGVTAVSGAETTFAWFRARGIQIALTSGFDTRVMSHLLEQLRWDDAVDEVVAADEVARGRPAPDLIEEAMRRSGVADPSAVLTAGDTTNDLEAAERAGVGINFGVLTGAHDRERFSAAPHTAILPGVADVPAWLESR